MKNNYRVFADNICKYRKSLNKSQMQFADFISQKLNSEGIKQEYTNKTISKWESADSMPDLEVLISLSKLMGITMDELCKSESPTFKNNEGNNIDEALIERFKDEPLLVEKLFEDEKPVLNESFNKLLVEKAVLRHQLMYKEPSFLSKLAKKVRNYGKRELICDYFN